MNTSDPTKPKPPEHKSILLIGPPGGGKSQLAMSFPSPEFIMCDPSKNLDGPDRELRKKLKLTYGWHDCDKDDKGSWIDLDQRYHRLIALIDVAKPSPSKTVIVDSLTSVDEFIIRTTIGMQDRKSIEIRDWKTIKSRFLHLLIAKLQSLPKTVIATVHENEDWVPSPTNPMLKELDSLSPSLSGSIANEVGAHFTDVWRCYSRPAAAGKVEWMIQPNATTKSRYLKNSLGMPSDIRIAQGDVAWNTIKQYTEGNV